MTLQEHKSIFKRYICMFKDEGLNMKQIKDVLIKSYDAELRENISSLINSGHTLKEISIYSGYVEGHISDIITNDYKNKTTEFKNNSLKDIQEIKKTKC